MEDYILSLERIAMARVISDSYEDVMRRIRRWYARHYYTPLHLVENKPDEEVLIEYFEHNFEEMNEEERSSKIKELSLTKEQKQEKAVDEDSFDKKLLEEMRQDLEKFKAKAEKALSKPATKESSIKTVKQEPEISVKFSESPEDMSGWE